jgi:formate C-acetyltransferase
MLKSLESVLNANHKNIKSYKQLERLYVSQIGADVKKHADEINAVKRNFPPAKYSDPFMSAFLQDCISRGKDMNDGGTIYPDFHGIAGMGLGTTADALAALKKLVFEQKRVSLPDLMAALSLNFTGHEIIRQELINHAPKFGNGDPYVDRIARWVAKVFCDAVHRHRTPGGGWHVPLMAANISNIYSGMEVGATPDGRPAKTPLSDAGSPHFGRDKKGPTAVIESLSNIDYTAVTGGTVVNMRFNPSVVKGEQGLNRLTALLKVFVKTRCQELQFNMTGSEIMKDAQKNPDNYRNLIVRVSGFSAYFNELSKEVQDDIISRTEHGSDNF